MSDNTLKVGLAQIAPAWLRRDRTLDKVVAWIGDAAAKGCDLVVFGEALVPGYPFWVERTEGAKFESQLQNEPAPVADFHFHPVESRAYRGIFKVKF